jgi:hypothetical protein
METRETALLCIKPTEMCETYVNPFETCFESSNVICFSVYIVLVGILLGNSIQMMFEISMLYSIEITYKPTALEKMQDPERFNEEEMNEQTNPDQKKEPPCYKVLPKCFGEIIYIICYLVIVTGVILCIVYTAKYGWVYTPLFEFGIAYIID